MVLNPAAGDAGEALEERIESAFGSARVRARITSVSDAGSLEERAREAAARADTVVAAGGDGTARAVAAALLRHDPAPILAVLPLGTRNHFARDLGIPDDLSAAIDVALEGGSARIDAGEVEGRIFLNNASIGLYPRIVEERPRRENGSGALGLLWATVKVLFRRHPHLHVTVQADGESLSARTQFVFVGNNEYRLEGAELGSRARLDAGVLTLCVSERSGRADLLRWVARSLLGRLEVAPDLTTRLVQEARVDARRDTIRVALDGEVLLMAPPLHYRIREGALTVKVPPREA